jgi:predicted CXXCH cytochrome family protein
MNSSIPSAASLLLLAAILFGTATNTGAQTGIVDTRHNLSVSGPGDLKALTETRICVFCHTPHSAEPSTPLWNRRLEAVNYILYGSSTMAATTGPPTGPSRLCLSCHDGTVALGAVLQPGSGISMSLAGGIPSERRSHLGTSLADDHPVSFSYYDALPNPELSPTLPPDLLFYGSGTLHCSTCHDAHDNSNKKFLAVNPVNGALCSRCHLKTGWAGGTHRYSPALWNGGLPDPWPRTGAATDFNWTTVEQNGCQNCHTPHAAGGADRLLSSESEEQNCYPCHNGNVASKNIQSQFLKPSRHHVEAFAGKHESGESPLFLTGHVECVDCHNPHASNSLQAVLAPSVSGKLAMVSGVDSNGVGIVPPAASRFEYEICFKCHADSSSLFPFIPRVIDTVNTRVEFGMSNPSYHPVQGSGRNPDVPSIPSSVSPDLTAASIIYCTDCHDSDESSAVGGAGPRGPHGSLYSPLLRERYETADNSMESSSAYALCYRCHNRSSILLDDSFRKSGAGRGGHSGHLGSMVNAPCSICHDPHGIQDNGLSGSHSHLINFDTRSVTSLPGSGLAYPVFTDKGSRSGSCTLVCHGIEHRDATHAY